MLLTVDLSARIAPAAGAPTDLGPATAQEAELLWKEGKAAFEASDFQAATNRLQRFVDRYPAHGGYLQAHRLLGEAYLGLAEQDRDAGRAAEAKARAKQALAPLRYFATGTRAAGEAAKGTILLGHAYLDTGKAREALLSAMEVEKQRLGGPGEGLRIEALLLKALAQLALGRPADAELAMAAAEAKLGQLASPPAPLVGETRLTRLRVKNDRCAALPSSARMEESQARDQLERRGTCVTEGMLLYKEVLKTGDTRAMDRATREALSAVEGYRRACLNPPDPPLRPRRTELQLRRYREELGQALARDCREKQRAALELVLSWKTDASLPAPGQPLAASVARALEQR